jgi:exosortase
MTAPTATLTRPRNLVPLLTLAVPTVCLLWAFGSTLVELRQAWADPQYSHGYLVPIFALALLYFRRQYLAIDKLQPSLWGFALLLAGLAIRLTGAFFHYVWFDTVSLIPTVAGVTLLLGGFAAWRWAWPSILFLAFMIPLPYRAATALSGPLQRLATVTSTFVMQVLGLPALAEGNVILLNDQKIGIVEACSGLRMLMVFFALATALVLVVPRHWIDKVIIVVSAIPIALISNIFRVTTTGIMYEMGYSEMANAFFHDVAGWLMMPIALGLLWVELKVLDLLFIEGPAPLPRSTRDPARRAALPSAPRPAATRRPAAQPAPRGPRPSQRELKRDTDHAPAPAERTGRPT